VLTIINVVATAFNNKYERRRIFLEKFRSMKKLLLLVGIASTLGVQAQMKEGRVVYKRTVQMQFQGQNIPEEIARQIPKSRTDHFELLFATNQSLYQVIPDMNSDGGESTFSSGGAVVRMRAAGNDDVTYSNFDTKKILRQTELMDQNFLIDETINSLAWKLTNETKTILGHPVTKATAQRTGTRPQVTMENGEMKRTMITDTSLVVAWFAQDIPVSAGPDFQGQLPGLILELDINNGRTLYQAVEISPKVTVASIKEPKKGKRVTPDEFSKEREKMFEQMRQFGGGNRTIRMN
jgi:GLPGLI family protein